MQKVGRSVRNNIIHHENILDDGFRDRENTVAVSNVNLKKQIFLKSQK